MTTQQNAIGLDSRVDEIQKERAGYQKIFLNGLPENLVIPPGTQYFVMRPSGRVNSGVIVGFEFFKSHPEVNAEMYRPQTEIRPREVYRLAEDTKQIKIRAIY